MLNKWTLFCLVEWVKKFKKTSPIFLACCKRMEGRGGILPWQSLLHCWILKWINIENESGSQMSAFISRHWNWNKAHKISTKNTFSESALLVALRLWGTKAANARVWCHLKAAWILTSQRLCLTLELSSTISEWELLFDLQFPSPGFV